MRDAAPANLTNSPTTSLTRFKHLCLLIFLSSGLTTYRKGWFLEDLANGAEKGSVIFDGFKNHINVFSVGLGNPEQRLVLLQVLLNADDRFAVVAADDVVLGVVDGYCFHLLAPHLFVILIILYTHNYQVSIGKSKSDLNWCIQKE
jgi:hypothetical protein